MKSIQRKDFIIAGVVDKSHGTKGELRLSFEQNSKIKEWVFLEIQGKPVPFFIEYRSDNQYEPIVKLEGIDTPNQSERFVGKNILIQATQTKRRTRAVDLDIIGYKLLDSTYGELGKVENIEEMPQQLLIYTTYKNNELLIPAVEAFIEEIDEKKKIIYLNLPEGMLDLQ